MTEDDIKAHAEWLAEQDWESVARKLWPEYGPLGIKGRADRTREMIAAALQEDHAEWLAEQKAVRPRHYVPPITQP